MVSSASSAADSGDHSAGLWITVLPDASAGASFQVLSMNGAFHGVMTTAGPAGMRCTDVVHVLRVPDPFVMRDDQVGVRAGS